MTKSNPANLPPPILTSEPGSFARRTFEVRIPRIIEDTIAAEDFPSDIVAALLDLRAEILHGVIAPLPPEAPDKAFWDAHSDSYFGRSWLDVPWYWAESYFYRRVLQATRYFQPGDWFRRDPYSNQKNGELKPDAGPYTLQVLLSNLPSSPKECYSVLLHASLWGNRTDLSYNVAQHTPGALAVAVERANVLVDDSARVWERLLANRGGHVQFICDNAGTELLHDLALADFLLREGLASRVTFHCKPQPFFVSDAMIKDAEAAVGALAGSTVPSLQRLGERLGRARAEGRLLLTDHWFWVTCLFFFQMPEDLEETLSRASLVISKGDANYRRLLEDAHWEPSTPFAEAVSYFPAPLVALRTLKSEIIVGLRPGQAEQLRQQDSEWQVNGKRGVVQYAEGGRH
jgi:hypothetical protein